MGAQWATAAPIAFTPMAMIAKVSRVVPLRMCQMEARASVPAFGPTLAERPTASHSRAIISTTTSRSEEHTSELQSLMRISYAVFCLKKKKKHKFNQKTYTQH